MLCLNWNIQGCVCHCNRYRPGVLEASMVGLEGIEVIVDNGDATIFQTTMAVRDPEVSALLEI